MMKLVMRKEVGSMKAMIEQWREKASLKTAMNEEETCRVEVMRQVISHMIRGKEGQVFAKWR